MAELWRDQWSASQSIKQFFWFLPFDLVPGLILAAPVAFGLVGLAAGQITSRRRRLLTTIAGGFLYLLLATIMMVIGSGISFRRGPFDLVLIFTISILKPVYAFGVFGFWLPEVHPKI
jgi:hypothetical protein